MLARDRSNVIVRNAILDLIPKRIVCRFLLLDFIADAVQMLLPVADLHLQMEQRDCKENSNAHDCNSDNARCTQFLTQASSLQSQ